jgi:catechol 2,3-dioxygenase-like lactoylglutathione lyase family enzyme
MKLEVQIIPVSDVDRSKAFYERVGWRLDEDVSPMDGLRIVQFTPPGSGTSVDFGLGITTAAPGAAEGTLVVTDIEAAREVLLSRGIEVSDIWHGHPDRNRSSSTRLAEQGHLHQRWRPSGRQRDLRDLSRRMS